MLSFVDALKGVEYEDLPRMLELLNTFSSYSSYNERDFERAGGYNVLQKLIFEYPENRQNQTEIDAIFD